MVEIKRKMTALYPWLTPIYHQIAQTFDEGLGHHAVLIKADSGLGVESLFNALAQKIMCVAQGDKPCGQCHSCHLMQAHSHPDYHELSPIDGKDIGVHQVRDINEIVAQHAQQNGNKVVYVQGVERLTEAAANALLKTLEEPRPNTYFLLQADSSASLLATIYSRCQVWNLSVPNEQTAVDWLKSKSAVENQAVFQNEDTCKTLQAANIAVLVRDKNEAALVKNELQKLGIASVYLSDQNSVFDSNVAKELAWVLKACLNVAERPILNAIATALFGLNAADIHQIQQNEAYWQRWADSFAQYQQTWQRQGILAMLHQILLEQGISERLLSQATGERDLTDFLHLAEILQQAATLHESEAALLSWFEKQIQGEGRQEAQIRLESERQLVKIVSIHKSKGLEYDLVWLPFLAAPSKDPSKKDINIYYSKERDETLWDIENRNLNALCEETFAEELRLLYVALTRAKYQMAFALPTQFDKKWNALHYVLSQGEIGKEIALSVPKDTETLLQTFKEKMQDNVKICTKPNLEAFPALSINTKNDDFKAAEFTGNIEQDWRITSFTSIEQAHRRQNYFTESAGKKHAVFDDAKDYDSQNSIEISTALLNESESSILDLPRGKQVGTALHRHFENCYFSDLANTEEIDKLRQSLQLDETFTEPLQNWLQQISHTPLSNEIGIALADLANKDCIKEMPFYLAIRAHFDVEAFNRALKAHHHLPSEPLQFEQIQGMVRGSIDLVFRHNGKYYLVDYKSNFLGSTLASYNQEALKKEMLHSHYDWQYLIYTLALHRYLKNVLPRYDYDRNFGGVFYLFLRGMNGEPQSGVFYDRPSVELITELDGVF